MPSSKKIYYILLKVVASQRENRKKIHYFILKTIQEEIPTAETAAALGRQDHHVC